jgi:hypothetical protein
MSAVTEALSDIKNRLDRAEKHMGISRNKFVSFLSRFRNLSFNTYFYF